MTASNSIMTSGPAVVRISLLRTLACCALVAGGFSLAGCGSSGPGVAGLPGNGVAEIAKESPEAASANISSLSDVVDRNPNSAEALTTRGVAYAKIGQYDSAISDFSKATQINPNSAAALTDRALAYRSIGRNEEAMADFNRAITANASHMPAYLGRANLERVQGQLDQARTTSTPRSS